MWGVKRRHEHGEHGSSLAGSLVEDIPLLYGSSYQQLASFMCLTEHMRTIPAVATSCHHLVISHQIISPSNAMGDSIMTTFGSSCVRSRHDPR